MATPQTQVAGPFGSSLTVRSDTWYAKRLVEFIGAGEPGPKGGRPQRVQVLLTADQAREIRDALDVAIKDAEATR